MKAKHSVPLAGLICSIALVCSLSAWWHFASRTSDSAIPSPANRRIAPLSHLEPRLITTIFLGEPRIYHVFLTWWVEQVFSRTDITSEQANQLFSDYDILAKHEPRSEWFYLGPCLVFSERLNRPDLCFSITGYGQRAVPESWRIPALQSYIEGRYLNNLERARFYIDIAAKKNGAPPSVVDLAAGINSGARGWQEVDLPALMGTSGFGRFALNKNKQG